MPLRISHERLKSLKHHWLTVSFVGGFVLDNITLNRVDQLGDNLFLLSYVLLAAISLALLYAGTADKLPQRMRSLTVKWMPLAVQFSFGGLLSGMLVFYSRAGSWAASWPFLLVIIAVILGNEFIKDRAQRLLFNLSVFFIGLFSYLVLVIPVITKKMGPLVFVTSGVLSLIIIYIYVRFLRLIIPNFIDLHLRHIVFTIGMTFAIFNFLYFGNVIPPIPLSLKEIGIYRTLEKQDNGDYVLTATKEPWYVFWHDGERVFEYRPGDRIYCYASVFAPTAFQTEIFHRWEYYDEASGNWITKNRVNYSIGGGRDQGYRGYSFIEQATPGAWRCAVETARGQELGRIGFEVEAGVPVGELETKIR